MGNEANWNTFAQTGKVSDYLAYVREEKGRNGWENAAKEERGTRERAGAHLRLRQRGKAPQKSAVCCNGTVYLWGVFYL